MAGNSKPISNSKRKLTFDTSAEEVTINPTEVVNTVEIRSIYSSRLKYIGTVSGKEYEWPSAGSVVSVNIEDAELLLSKRIGGRGCCGAVNQGGNRLFELV